MPTGIAGCPLKGAAHLPTVRYGSSVARREDALPVDHQGGEHDDPRGNVRVEVGIAVKIRVGDVIHQRDESRQEGDKDKGARDLTPHRELASVRSYLRACSQPLLYTAPGLGAARSPDPSACAWTRGGALLP